LWDFYTIGFNFEKDMFTGEVLAMAEKNAASGPTPQRGALLVTMKPSSPIISAGSNFSISVTINNPFDVPVHIEDVTTMLPVDLYDVNQLALARQKDKDRKELEERISEQTKSDKFLESLLRTIFFFLPDFGWINYSGLITPTANVIATAVESTWKPDRIDINTQAGETLEDKDKRLQQAIHKFEADSINKYIRVKSVEIQPGDSITRVFVLHTRRGLMFTPTIYNLDISIKFKIDPIMHN
jgi:hypothetical protein